MRGGKGERGEREREVKGEGKEEREEEKRGRRDICTPIYLLPTHTHTPVLIAPMAASRNARSLESTA